MLARKTNNNKNKKNKNPVPTNKRTKKQVQPKNNILTPVYNKSVSFRPLPSRAMVPVMSACALKYAMSIAKPFAVESLGACIPSMPSQASHKVAGFIRGDGVIGTSGVGWILVTPSVVNDAPSIFYTQSGYTSSSIIPLSAIATTLNTGVATSYCSNLPYNSSEVATAAVTDAPNLRGRIVSCGITVQYTGTALNESGMIYLTRDPNHNNVAFQTGSNVLVPSSVSSLGGYQYTELCPFTREKCLAVDFASRYTELNYPEPGSGATVAQTVTQACYPFASPSSLLPQPANASSAYTLTTAASVVVTVGNPTIAVMITGVAGQSFHFEYTIHAEFVGSNAQANLTPSESDADGMGVVMVAANQLAQRKVASPTASYWDLMYQGLAYAAKKAAPVIIPALEKAALALLL